MRPRASDQNYNYASNCINVIIVMHMSEEKYTSIRVRASTAEQLKILGRKGESYDDVVVWLLKNSKKRKLHSVVTSPKPASNELSRELPERRQDLGEEWHP